MTSQLLFIISVRGPSCSPQHWRCAAWSLQKLDQRSLRGETFSGERAWRMGGSNSGCCFNLRLHLHVAGGVSECAQSAHAATSTGSPQNHREGCKGEAEGWVRLHLRLNPETPLPQLPSSFFLTADYIHCAQVVAHHTIQCCGNWSVGHPCTLMVISEAGCSLHEPGLHCLCPGSLPIFPALPLQRPLISEKKWCWHLLVIFQMLMYW